MGKFETNIDESMKTNILNKFDLLGEYDIQDILTRVSHLPDDANLTGTVAD